MAHAVQCLEQECISQDGRVAFKLGDPLRFAEEMAGETRIAPDPEGASDLCIRSNQIRPFSATVDGIHGGKR